MQQNSNREKEKVEENWADPNNEIVSFKTRLVKDIAERLAFLKSEYFLVELLCLKEIKRAQFEDSDLYNFGIIWVIQREQDWDDHQLKDEEEIDQVLENPREKYSKNTIANYECLYCFLEALLNIFDELLARSWFATLSIQLHHITYFLQIVRLAR